MATVAAYIATGAGPTTASAEGGIKFNREDTATGTTPIQKPNAAGTAYSWIKNLFLQVTAGTSTAISNRKIRWASSPAAGLTGHFKDGGGTYAQASGANAPSDNGTTNDATPAGYTALTTSFQSWDDVSASAVSTGRNGNYVQVVVGISNNYVGGAGSAVTLPNIELQYDEA